MAAGGGQNDPAVAGGTKQHWRVIQDEKQLRAMRWNRWWGYNWNRKKRELVRQQRLKSAKQARLARAKLPTTVGCSGDRPCSPPKTKVTRKTRWRDRCRRVKQFFSEHRPSLKFSKDAFRKQTQKVKFRVNSTDALKRVRDVLKSIKCGPLMKRFRKRSKCAEDGQSDRGSSYSASPPRHTDKPNKSSEKESVPTCMDAGLLSDSRVDKGFHPSYIGRLVPTHPLGPWVQLSPVGLTKQPLDYDEPPTSLQLSAGSQPKSSLSATSLDYLASRVNYMRNLYLHMEASERWSHRDPNNPDHRASNVSPPAAVPRKVTQVFNSGVKQQAHGPMSRGCSSGWRGPSASKQVAGVQPATGPAWQPEPPRWSDVGRPYYPLPHATRPSWGHQGRTTARLRPRAPLFRPGHPSSVIGTDMFAGRTSLPSWRLQSLPSPYVDHVTSPAILTDRAARFHDYCFGRLYPFYRNPCCFGAPKSVTTQTEELPQDLRVPDQPTCVRCQRSSSSLESVDVSTQTEVHRLDRGTNPFLDAVIDHTDNTEGMMVAKGREHGNSGQSTPASMPGTSQASAGSSQALTSWSDSEKTPNVAESVVVEQTVMAVMQEARQDALALGRELMAAHSAARATKNPFRTAAAERNAQTPPISWIIDSVLPDVMDTGLRPPPPPAPPPSFSFPREHNRQQKTENKSEEDGRPFSLFCIPADSKPPWWE